MKGDKSPDELIAAFGLTDQEGKATIDSPLFPETTKQAFSEYLKAIRKFDAASKVEQDFGIPTRQGIEADGQRRQIHDSVAKLVEADLGLSFDASRSLVAKIRDGALPGHGENRAYARGIAKQVENWGGDLGNWSKTVTEDFQSTLDRATR